jgi:hypothetical protein
MDDRWQRRALALQTAKERYEWKRTAIEKLLAEAKAEFDAAVREANAVIPKYAAKPRDKVREKAARLLAMRERRSAANV